MTMLPPYLVCEFDKKTLSSLVRERFGNDFPNIHRKRQIQFIYNYLKDLNAKTVLLESEYVDRDYLEDYSRYYVKCFNRYGERCARLHFFSHEFDAKDFNEILTQYDESEIKKYQENYLGFIVVKPLPKTFIGKTCLKIYPSFNRSDDKIVLAQKYTVNLFGIELTLDSIAFQEQDKITSACATTAIWAMLHAQSELNNRKLPSCSAITLSAINHIADSSNSFPNAGLTNKQILRAIDTQNLRNHKIEFKKNITIEQFTNLVKTLTKSKIPAILGADVYRINGDGEPSRLDGHAVTVVGAKTGSENSIYIHDDRVGPFAKATLAKMTDIQLDIKNENCDWCITIQDKDDSGTWLKPKEILIPDCLIISTNNKVRIPLEFIENTCFSIQEEWHRYLSKYFELAPDELPTIEYDISLQSLSEFKSAVMRNKEIKNKFDTLTSGYARFLWISTFYTKNKETIFQIAFDATDIPQGNAVSKISIYNEEIFTEIRDLFREMQIHDTDSTNEDDHDKKNFIESFIRNLQDKNDGYFGYLTQKYGALNAPRKIKSGEIHNGDLPIRTDLKRYYGRNDRKLQDDFPDLFTAPSNGKFKIWVISADGELIIGEEIDDMGHPTLTGFKSARIAGELRYDGTTWTINAKSGRFSKNYPNSDELLLNALGRFKEIYNLEEYIVTDLPR